MSDSYQAIYDAVRSRISGGDVGEAVRSAAAQAFDISFTVPAIAQQMYWAIEQHGRPSAVYRPSLSVDGNMYCALYGENLVEGCAGFGETPEAAMADFDKNWREQKAAKVSREGIHPDSRFGVGA